MMMVTSKLWRSVALGSFLALAACASLLPSGHQTTKREALPGGEFRLDPKHATILFKVDHLGFSTYVGRFNTFDASLSFDPDEPQKSVLTVLVETASIDVNLPSFEEELRGPSWFNTALLPQARFVSQAITVTGERTGLVEGAFTLLGETRPLVLDVDFNGGATNFATGDYTLGFSAQAAFDRTAFGLDSFAPAVGAEVTLEIHAEFIRQP